MKGFPGSPKETSSRRRIAAAGATALLVTFVFVAANAIWYQPHAHRSPFLATRHVEQPPAAVVPSNEPDAVVESVPAPSPREDHGSESTRTAQSGNEPIPVPSGSDRPVKDVQKVMTELGLYEGEIDGIAGPMTRAAIEAYQNRIGIDPTGRIDEELLARLGIAGEPAESVVPAPPAPRPRGSETDNLQTAALGDQVPRDERVMRIQAGLKAFGNDGIEIDGRMGSRTEAAIREFQSLFGLPVTGEPDDTLYAKMRDIGLTD
jgi:peptidoglycan hydrolase-like protein with peptidoglycan-binding domain